MTIGSHIIRLRVQSDQNNQSYSPLNLEKIAEFDFVYILASANIDQSAPNLVKIDMTSISQISTILCLIGPERPELMTLELGKNGCIRLCLNFIYKYKSVNTKFGQYVYGRKISD